MSKIKILWLSCMVLGIVMVLQFTLIFWLYPSRTTDQTQNLTVVLDAGHGGIDNGVVGKVTGVNESDLNLKMCRLIEKQLKNRGVKVELTRKDYGGLYGSLSAGFKRRDMEKRREIIKAVKPDLVISIHMNKFPMSYRSGPQVFYQKGDEDSILFAQCMQSALNNFTGNKHASLAGDYFILKCIEKPSIIVECGFLSNADDEAKLNNETYRQQLSEHIVRGIFVYLYSL